jgi:kynureninase
MPLHREDARRRDRNDPLSAFRERFLIADPDLIYLLGNSLGRLPKATAARLDELINSAWGERLIRSWSDSWMDLPQQIGAKIAALLKAAPGEIIVADSTSVNLYKAVVAALRMRPVRPKILSDDLNFPSDLYILEGAARATDRRRELRLIPSRDGISGPEADILAAIDEETAVVVLTHAVFKSAFLYDMARITARAHAMGALVVWDLSHSAGAIPIDLTAACADFAVGCTYKYLNGGPGAPAFIFVHGELQADAENPISGWMGHHEPFAFGLAYDPAPGMRRFLSGTPPILSLAAIEPGIDLLLEAGIENIRAKSLAQTRYLIELWEEMLAPLGFELRTPRDDARRGSHIALGHPEGLRISRALQAEMNVIPDFRHPDNLRLSTAPLYTTYCELFDAADRLRAVVAERRYAHYPTAIPRVT